MHYAILCFYDFMRYEVFSSLLFGPVQTGRLQTESDAYEPTVHNAKVGSKGHEWVKCIKWHLISQLVPVLFPTALAVEFIKTELFVCVSHCVGTLMAERIDVRSQNLVKGYIGLDDISGEFGGQGHRSRSSS